MSCALVTICSSTGNFFFPIVGGRGAPCALNQTKTTPNFQTVGFEHHEHQRANTAEDQRYCTGQLVHTEVGKLGHIYIDLDNWRRGRLDRNFRAGLRVPLDRKQIVGHTHDNQLELRVVLQRGRVTVVLDRWCQLTADLQYIAE
jgi:hypothetical protein